MIQSLSVVAAVRLQYRTTVAWDFSICDGTSMLEPRLLVEDLVPRLPDVSWAVYTRQRKQ
jgi:hypothetical protein